MGLGLLAAGLHNRAQRTIIGVWRSVTFTLMQAMLNGDFSVVVALPQVRVMRQCNVLTVLPAQITNEALHL